MTIKPIETRYAGCRFRSRLEARWAVFFDAIGALWEYEPQGFAIDGRPYLPDFLLVDSGTWVEVKGAEGDLDHALMLAAATQLPEIPALYDPGPRLLVLGPMPEPIESGDWGWLGFTAAMDQEGEPLPLGGWWGFGLYQKNRRPWQLYGTSTATPDVFGEDGWNPPKWLAPAVDPDEPGALAAYRVARSARFEHGESG